MNKQRIRLVVGVFLVTLLLSSLAGQIVRLDSPLAATYYKKATFAGGCFWCMEPPFEALNGVISVISGYSGGTTHNPSYKQVIGGRTGHLESVQVTYDPQKVSYERLLQVYWQNIDPTDRGGQFGDRGSQYHTAIFFHDPQQKEAASNSKYDLNNSGKFKDAIATQVLGYAKFWPAEDYHQDYYQKNPTRYKRYKVGSGRAGYIEQTWDNDDTAFNRNKTFKKPTKSELKSSLSKMAYNVTQECGTEPAFSNAYWNNKEAGIYVDVIGGEALFSSKDKFNSGTGWPSFSRPLVDTNIIEKEDRKYAMVRTEVRSHQGDSHLGHLFNDGPTSTGMRYCINSASLKFIPLAEMEAQGYGKYISSVIQ